MSPRPAVQVELHPGGSGDEIPLSSPPHPPRPVRQLDLTLEVPWTFITQASQREQEDVDKSHSFLPCSPFLGVSGTMPHNQ